MIRPEKSLTVPSFDTVRAHWRVVAVSIWGTHIVYHRAKRTLNSTELGGREQSAREDAGHYTMVPVGTIAIDEAAVGYGRIGR